MNRRWLFGFFLVSGFCSLVLEVVWLRLAMARFGVTTALTSIVLSVFMGGLALGSWGAGRLSRGLSRRPPALALRLYAAAEIAIAFGATAAPWLLDWGRNVLLGATSQSGWDSAAYHAGAALFVTVALLPFCACMGATFPLAISILGRDPAGDRRRSFSYLYLANVIGATVGTLLSAFVLIERLGFRGTLSTVAFLNASLGALALGLSLTPPLAAPGTPFADDAPGDGPGRAPRGALVALFLTGLTSMGMELVWIRELTPYMGSVVYTFATILGGYLAATFVGSALYRRWSSRRDAESLQALSPRLWGLLAIAAMLPLVAADPRIPLDRSFGTGALRAAFGTWPFCAALGFVTPFLTDRWSGGDPRRVGSAYALNVLGCILGPLLAGFLLLPALGESGAITALSLLLLGAGAAGAFRAAEPGPRRDGALSTAGAAVLIVLVFSLARTFESLVPHAVVRRDATATVAAYGEGMGRGILVNGIGMTHLTPITKMMAHLPLAFHDPRAERALIICFGMGTSYRSALSWDVRTTAVELVPSVPALFPLFHEDAASLLASPLGRIVVDDGRRYLERSADVYDVVIVDPPPPVQAAGSSLLYSREFYRMVCRRLDARGIVQQWIPGGEPIVVASLMKALMDTFPHVRGFRSLEGWGYHLLASMEPIPPLSAEALAAALPARAVRDITEWGPHATAAEQFAAVLAQELPLAEMVPPGVPALTDDRPLNEYYFLRTTLGL